MCEELKSDWKCHKPECHKPKCELVCENPTCKPKVDCYSCQAVASGILPKFQMFKETEINPTCCPCGNIYSLNNKFKFI